MSASVCWLPRIGGRGPHSSVGAGAATRVGCKPAGPAQMGLGRADPTGLCLRGQGRGQPEGTGGSCIAPVQPDPAPCSARTRALPPPGPPGTAWAGKHPAPDTGVLAERGREVSGNRRPIVEASAPGREAVPAPLGAEAEPGRACVVGAAAPRPFLEWHPHGFLGSWPFESQPKASYDRGNSQAGRSTCRGPGG